MHAVAEASWTTTRGGCSPTATACPGRPPTSSNSSRPVPSTRTAARRCWSVRCCCPRSSSAELPGDERGPSAPADGGDSARRALDAARAAAAIPDHPRLVQVFDIFVDGGQPVDRQRTRRRPAARRVARRKAAEPVPGRRGRLRHPDRAARRCTPTAGRTATSPPPPCWSATTAAPCSAGSPPAPPRRRCAATTRCRRRYPRWPAAATAEPAAPRSPGWGGPRLPLEWERARQARITVVGRGNRALGARTGPRGYRATGGSPRRSALPPTCGRSARCSTAASRAIRPSPRRTPPNSSGWSAPEPPAFAEECGPLRPVVESLLRRDPGERPHAEELERPAPLPDPLRARA